MCCLITFISHFTFAASDKSTATPTYKISADAKLSTQYIERGLAISDGNPALNASFIFNLGPQFRFGFWGSNISNISSNDDNFWLKLLADVHVDFNQNSNLAIYLNDDHFYKSSVRNGQRAGLKYNYFLYLAEVEWMNNFEGTHTDSVYFNGGKLFDFRQSMKYGGKLGYTVQHSVNYANYFDFKLLGIYDINKNANVEVGFTLSTQSSQFNNRGDPAIYASISLSN
jgi:hypothetical protein